MKCLSRVALILVATATVLAAPAAQAQTDHQGLYLVVAGGRSHINYDCGIYLSCSSAMTSTGKLAGGYRFGAFAAEAWYTDFGKVEIGNPLRGANTLRLRAAGISGVWYLHVDDTWKGLLRAGGAQVMQTRTDDGRRNALQPTLGLGVVKELTPALALELAWDFTLADGNNTSTSMVNLATVGLRLGF